ncbi:MAG: OmpA family protein [Candidatus Zixiibacteriota bacterium]
MRRIVFTLIICIFAASVAAQDFKYSLGAGAGLVGTAGGSGFDFNRKLFFGGSIGNRLTDHWAFFIDGSYGKLASTKYPFASGTDSTVDFMALRLVGTINYRLFSKGNSFHTYLGVGGGLLSWKMVNPVGDTTYKVTGIKSLAVNFAAPELLASANLRFLILPTRHTSFNLTLTGDYLTGAGAEFDKSVDDKRNRWLYGAQLSFNFLIGSNVSKEKWKSDESWKDKPASGATVARKPGVATALDSDADGVPDDADKCPGTARGAVVDANGCPMDSDGDGVPDGLDDCPETPREARGFVDVNGCAVDNDLDGVADYKDSCLNNRVGAQVDANGCPVDSDGDGVPDGLDDCPNTLKGIPVDKYGCTDVTIFSKPMMLYIDYDPGGFEVDPKNKARLEQLARILNLVPAIKLEINAYTDDIGTDIANQKLSEKRAARVREYLVIYGVAADRIKTVGKGENDFAASNQTAEGRARNRRIEILFYQ